MYASTAFLTGRYVTSRVFTAPRWPLMATFDRTHACDVTALSGQSLVYQYDTLSVHDDQRNNQKERGKNMGHC